MSSSAASASDNESSIASVELVLNSRSTLAAWLAIATWARVTVAARKVSSRVCNALALAVMRRGRIEHLDSPPVVFHTPANRFVAAFMGEASFLPIATTGETAFTALGPVATGPATNGAPGGAVAGKLAMVRPDDVVFKADPGGDAVIVAAEFRGVAWCYTIRLVDGEEVLSAMSHLDPQAVGTRGRVRLTPGHPQIVIPDGVADTDAAAPDSATT